MTYDLDVCGLDYPFTLAHAVGAARLVSTPSLSGLARDCHVTGFPEFGQFYFLGFPEEHSIFQVRCVYRSATSARAVGAHLCPAGPAIAMIQECG